MNMCTCTYIYIHTHWSHVYVLFHLFVCMFTCRKFVFAFVCLALAFVFTFKCWRQCFYYFGYTPFVHQSENTRGCQVVGVHWAPMYMSIWVVVKIMVPFGVP